MTMPPPSPRPAPPDGRRLTTERIGCLDPLLQRLLDAGALASIGTVGDSYDNALAGIDDRPLQDRMHAP